MKIQVGARNCLLCPMPVTLVGANVNGKPNYNTIAYVGIITHNSISVGMSKRHYTNAGIKENKTFSVNIPSVEMVKETDYCGIVSGKDVDKSNLFETFYGDLKTAPMITECPVNIECRLVRTLDFPEADVFIGEIVETHVNEQCMQDNAVDFSKVQPILFVTEERNYWKLGDRFAEAWKIGEELKNR